MDYIQGEKKTSTLRIYIVLHKRIVKVEKYIKKKMTNFANIKNSQKLFLSQSSIVKFILYNYKILVKIGILN